MSIINLKLILNYHILLVHLVKLYLILINSLDFNIQFGNLTMIFTFKQKLNK